MTPPCMRRSRSLSEMQKAVTAGAFKGGGIAVWEEAKALESLVVSCASHPSTQESEVELP